MKTRIISLILCLAMCFSIITVLSSCKSESKPDAFVIMTDALDGVFNPFFATTGADMGVVGLTQIGMLTTGYENGEVTIAYGENEAVVTKDFESKFDPASGNTTYTFVIKNGIKYSDGEALTIEDVLFNLYVYLDPVYTGSSTMYSTDILGLNDYRTQTQSSGDNDTDDVITTTANTLANNRLNELINLFKEVGTKGTQGTYSATIEQMKAAIANHSLSSGYKEAISNKPEEVTNDQLLADYNLVLDFFMDEIKNDYISAQEAYTEEPYKSHPEFKDPIFCFMCYEGFVNIEYELNEENKPDRSKIKKLTKMYSADNEEAAINYVYNNKISSSLHEILKYWATANKVQTEFFAKAKEVVLHQNIKDGQLLVENISGIVSLGHVEGGVDEITVNNNTYKIAKEHNEDGAPKNEGEYDVLEITIKGVDPKAVWNFAFTVAPQHYYAEGYDVDIANNKFGVDYASYDYMTKVIQAVRNIKVPVGAGAYKASDADNSDNPADDGTGFFANNVVYYKANNYFETVGEGISNAKIEKVRYQVISSSNALNALESGAVHYVTPQLTDDNIKKIDALKDKGIDSTYTDQLGYGYIGINAGKVKDINIRKAIMSAMNTSLALSYYRTGTAQTIYWPMSMVNWAYPKTDDGKPDRDNGRDYPAVNFSDEAAKEAILGYMEAAGVSEGDESLSIKFTIAGSNLTDHPSYNTLQHAADLLNSCGWEIEVVADTQALTKLSTGSLSVWAAAWGSTVDPDMYQVYHKNSTASSVLAWGYREILASPDVYVEENAILTDLSDLIDQARETEDRATRSRLYRQAMQLVLDLAIELPVYQRSTLYAYNTNVIDVNSIPSKEELNPYTSPIDKLWEVEFAK